MTAKPLPSGSLFPIAVPTDDDLESLKEFQLICSSEQGVTGIYTIPDHELYSEIPMQYMDLVRCFLWRREVFKTLLKKNIVSKLDQECQDALRRNALYLEKVLRHIQKHLQTAANTNPPGHVRLFDIYMLQDYFVGRHDPAAVILWQRGHTQNLRNTDILSPDVEPCKRFGAEWEGSRYRWSIGKLDPAGEAKLVKDGKLLFGDFYDHPYQRMEVVNEEVEANRTYNSDVIAEYNEDG
ncbi:hypothetical protein PAXRUDRAFT_17060 [Paxillus rubicundulus Ve08.2h10]|uniref:Uncharacterized protein n=1 Tax=Paxillus rubicundulus Ve08.2h10 TaxID=930991 RepID=A0A0D0C4P6_9AGAM|nr:hypothetical protein PAXRUDRAFT_17060 [Paxillus rubicundulus Ve08.2h10]